MGEFTKLVVVITLVMEIIITWGWGKAKGIVNYSCSKN